MLLTGRSKNKPDPIESFEKTGKSDLPGFFISAFRDRFPISGWNRSPSCGMDDGGRLVKSSEILPEKDPPRLNSRKTGLLPKKIFPPTRKNRKSERGIILRIGDLPFQDGFERAKGSEDRKEKNRSDREISRCETQWSAFPEAFFSLQTRRRATA